MKAVDLQAQMPEIIEHLHQMWPHSRLVHGKARHSESQGGIERLNRTAVEKLGAWMQENKSTHWGIGRKFVQWSINTQISRAIGNTTPYKLVFGQHPSVGISSLPISKELLEKLHTGSAHP